MAKKKKSGASSGSASKSGTPTTQSSIPNDDASNRHEPSATLDPFSEDAQGEEEDGFDIADDLLAALDAQDEAKAKGKNKAKGSGGLEVPTSGSGNGGTGSARRRRSVGEMIAEKGARLLGRSPSKDPPSPLNTHTSASASGAADDASALSTSPGAGGTSGGESDGAKPKSPSHRMGSIRKMFGKGHSHDEEEEDGMVDGENGGEVQGGGSNGASGLGIGGTRGKKKVSRQQQRKERKAAEVAAIKAQAEAELKANGGKPDEAERERVGMQELCQVLKREMVEINPDGHCLYAAVADQLNTLGKVAGHVTYQDTRRATASHMRSHADDFIPFISDSDESMAGISNDEAGKDGEEVREAQHKHYLSYCDAVESTGVWGGQPEILALSRAYGTPIHVVQVGSPVLKVGEGEQSGEPLIISYHRRMYGLGEHYNSMRKKVEA